VDIHLQMYICKETILKSQLTNIKNNTLNRKHKRIWGWETQTNTNKTLIWMSQSNIIRVGAYKQTLTKKRQQSQII
jgi:phage head maturation protease